MRFGGLLERIDAMDQRHDALAAKYGMTSRSNARTIAVFSSTGRGRSTEPRMLKRFTKTRPTSSSPLRPPMTPITARRPPTASERDVLREVRAAQVVEDHVDAAFVRVALHRFREVLFL